NIAEILTATDDNGDPQVDDDSTPDNIPDNDVVNNDNDVSGNGNDGEDEDDHDYADVTTEAFDLALIKLLAPGQSASVEPGDTVHYVIRVINQGMIAADNIVVQDNVPGAMVYEGGITGNDDEGWSFSGGIVTRTINVGDELTAALQPGESVEVDIYLTLNDPLPAGTQVRNIAEILTATDDNGDPQVDDDSTPDN
ncbi:MAG: DUF11 domain-containing protein, partial [Lewinella sp.]|nr:DUF11 domain-containing protein [Lewinella sp.]